MFSRRKSLLPLIAFCLIAFGAVMLPAQAGVNIKGSSIWVGNTEYLRFGSNQVTVVASGGVVPAASAREYQLGFGSAKAGATAGWAVAAGADLYEWTLPAGSTNSTLVIPVSGLHVGDTITAFKCQVQIESAGATATLNGALRKLTNTAADPADALVGAFTQVTATSDTKAQPSKTGLSDVVGTDERFYILLTGTTAALTDMRGLGCSVTTTAG